MIPFNVAPFLGPELKYIREAVENEHICGDGKYTRLCNAWMENRFHYDENGNSNWETADYPIFSTNDAANNKECSTFWMKDATYLRLKNVELAYHIPSKWLKNVTLDKAKIYFSTYNPYTWSYLGKYKVDAEDWLAGVERYFRTRTFNIGVDLTF